MRLATIAVLLLAATRASAQDAVQTDRDKYKAILENECVRVLEYTDRPGDRTHQHRHPAFVLYALSSFKRTITLPSGKVLKREFKAGDVMWSDEQTHIGENVGDTPTRVIIVELKKQREGCAKQPSDTADHSGR
ncbi:MAG: cytoplasmic protein [Betaproteobacteria bacterium]|nr:MAG: cytoplasmic protein [Betaproteobacteria bacterium]